MFAELAVVVEELARQARLQTTSTTSIRVATNAKATVRDRLREYLPAIKRTAVALATHKPGLKATFKLPRPGDQELLNAALVFLKEVEPLVADFASHEMPDVLVNLRRDIDAFHAAVTESNNSNAARIEATASVREVLASGIEIMRHLDAIVRNKFADDKPMLAAWESASHVERKKYRRSRDRANPESSEVSEPGQEPGTRQTHSN